MNDLLITSYIELEKLLGQHESLVLDFKRSSIFYGKKDLPDRNSYLDKLTKSISAFANTEGGQVVIGIECKQANGLPDQATGIDDGIAYADLNPETIQRSLVSNISPLLLNLRFLPIPNPSNSERYYLIINVPKGTTAYQARDKKYYGRNEYENTPLHDNLIRSLMARAQRPNAFVSLEDVSVSPAGLATKSLKDSPESRRRTQREEKVKTYRCEFSTVMENIGDYNISEFRTTLRISGSFNDPQYKPLYRAEHLFEDGDDLSFRDGYKPPPQTPHQKRNRDRSVQPLELSIYPGQRFDINKYSFIFSDLEIWQNPLSLEWTLYLRDTQPIYGDIDMSKLLENSISSILG